jgi:hypothetical protein
MLGRQQLWRTDYAHWMMLFLQVLELIVLIPLLVAHIIRNSTAEQLPQYSSVGFAESAHYNGLAVVPVCS